jgi:Fic-DOC domain mobile mystery protein B
MTDPLFDGDDDAATPITPDERAQLIPTWITTRAELNAAEGENIDEADRWAFSRRRDVLDADFLKRLHQRMLGKVWKWAGTIRTTERNIGIAPYRIEPELRQLLDDARYWVESETFPPDEIAIRFHHRLVAIHPFPNGNGRHTRIAADLLLVRMGKPRFTWGRTSLVDASETRDAYIAGLRAADAHDIAPLLAFARN